MSNFSLLPIRTIIICLLLISLNPAQSIPSCTNFTLPPFGPENVYTQTSCEMACVEGADLVRGDFTDTSVSTLFSDISCACTIGELKTKLTICEIIHSGSLFAAHSYLATFAAVTTGMVLTFL